MRALVAFIIMLGVLVPIGLLAANMAAYGHPFGEAYKLRKQARRAGIVQAVDSELAQRNFGWSLGAVELFRRVLDNDGAYLSEALRKDIEAAINSSVVSRLKELNEK